jgi:hypothetical protein
VSLLGGGKSPFHADDGSADPRAAGALAAFGSGQGSEHAALTALAASRLLVPIVAAPGEGAGGDPGRDPGREPGRDPGRDRGLDPGGDPGPGPGALAGPAAAAERGAEMSLPTLIGRDGRPAIPAFTSMDALARWDPHARPVPAFAGQVWRAAMDSESAVVVDVAGPVRLAIEGARLAALADGQPVPLPHEDPDVLAAVRAAAAGQPAIAAIRIASGADPVPDGPVPDGPVPDDPVPDDPAAGQIAVGGVSDLHIDLTLADGCAPEAGEAAARLLGAALMEQLGARLRRGITIAVTRSDGHGGS